MIPLKYVSNFWRAFEMPLINCEFCLMVTRLKNCFLVAGSAANQEQIFTIIDTKLCVPVVILSTQYNIKLFKQLDPGFRRKIKININLK